MKPLALMSSTVAVLLVTAGHTLALPTTPQALLQPQAHLGAAPSPIHKVHKRNYRHCHGSGSKRWCHGPRQPRGSHSGQARQATGTVDK